MSATDELSSWLDRIENYLRAHGPTELGSLGHDNAVPRPPGVKMRLQAALQSQPERFALKTHSNSGCVVHLSDSQGWQAELLELSASQGAGSSHSTGVHGMQVRQVRQVRTVPVDGAHLDYAALLTRTQIRRTRTRTQTRTCAASVTEHKFDDESLQSMYRTISALARRYRTSAWPVNRAQLQDVNGSTLHAMSRCRYVSVKGGSELTWNVPRVWDAVTRMPERFKSDALEVAAPV